VDSPLLRRVEIENQRAGEELPTLSGREVKGQINLIQPGARVEVFPVQAKGKSGSNHPRRHFAGKRAVGGAGLQGGEAQDTITPVEASA